MSGAFYLIVLVVIAVFVLAGVMALVGSGSAYDQIGRGGLSPEEPSDSHSAPEPDPAAESEAEIRQMLEARSERLVRQGKEPLDVEAELRRLAWTQSERADPGLVEETRQLIAARSERRVREGLAPLDVEAEVARTLRELKASG